MDVRNLIVALERTGLTVKGLEHVAALERTPAFPAELAYPTETERRAIFTAAHRRGGPSAVAAEVGRVAVLESRTAADARNVCEAEKHFSVAAALEKCVPAIVRALSPALAEAKAAVTASEDAMAAEKLTRPRLEYVTPEGQPTGSMMRTSAGTLHQEAAQRGPAALAAWQAWRAADERHRAIVRLIDLLRRDALLTNEHPVTRARFTEPVAAPHPVDVRTAAEVAAERDRRAGAAFTVADLPPDRQRPDERARYAR